MHHSVFQVLAVHPNGEMEAGTAWFSEDAQKYAEQRYPHVAADSLYGLTNAHVVNGASTLFSRHVVCRRTDLPLSVCGVAGDVDLAVVRLSGSAKRLLERQLREKAGLTSVPMLRMIDSDNVVMPAKYDPMEAQASVLAVGHPLGSEFQTQTKGVCEGFKRVQTGASSLYIAHTATIQPGNSGGPLLYKNAGVVGINSMKATGTCGIPSSLFFWCVSHSHSLSVCLCLSLCRRDYGQSQHGDSKSANSKLSASYAR